MQWLDNERVAERIAKAEGRREAFREAAEWCVERIDGQKQWRKGLTAAEAMDRSFSVQKTWENARDHFRKLAAEE